MIRGEEKKKNSCLCVLVNVFMCVWVSMHVSIQTSVSVHV